MQSVGGKDMAWSFDDPGLAQRFAEAFRKAGGKADMLAFLMLTPEVMERLVADPEYAYIEFSALSDRARVACRHFCLYTLAEVTRKTAQEFSALPGVGKKSIQELREGLAAHGLFLKGEGPQ